MPPPPPNSLELPQRKPRQSKAPPRRTLEYSGEPEPDYEEADTDDATALPELDNKLRRVSIPLALTMSGGPPQLLAICSTRSSNGCSSMRRCVWSGGVRSCYESSMMSSPRDTLLYSRRLIDHTRSHHGARWSGSNKRELPDAVCGERVIHARRYCIIFAPSAASSTSSVVCDRRWRRPLKLPATNLPASTSKTALVIGPDPHPDAGEPILSSSASSGHRAYKAGS